MLKESTEAHVPTPCYGHAMLISHKRGETAVHGCHCPGDMAARMREVGVCVPLAFKFVSFKFNPVLNELVP